MPPDNPTVASTRLLRQAFTMGSVTKATPIQFINSKSHIKKRKDRKTALSGYYACLSRDLLLMASGADTHAHTHTHTRKHTDIRGRNDFKKPGASTPGLKILGNSGGNTVIGKFLSIVGSSLMGMALRWAV